MSVYDCLPNGSQVKCWECEMRDIKKGGSVPPIDSHRNYVVLLREGGAVVVEDCIVVSILESTYLEDGELIERVPVFDKYGNEVDFKLPGLLGEEHYFFR